jgi:hypothetical protein
MAMTANDRRAYRVDDMQDHTVMSGNERREMLEVWLPIAQGP